MLTSTKLVMDAMLARELGTAGVHFAPFTTIIYKSILPNGGIHKGMCQAIAAGNRASPLSHGLTVRCGRAQAGSV